MNDNNGLHRSFDYNYGAQKPQFAQELPQTLRGHYTESGARHAEAGQAVTHVYNILPNFWRGYKCGNEQDGALSIGTATIKRWKGIPRPFGDSVRYCCYSVRYQNTTSGEDVSLEFLCADQPYCPPDELEQLRPKNRLGFLESIQTPIPLYGYYLYGAGVPTSYWWLDAHGDIAIVSSTFETLVLKEKLVDNS